MRILCFTGDSGAGKTTLIERLLSHLPLDPASVGILKHTHHRLDWHPPGKDTTRFWQTGVGSVAVVDPAQIACFQRADHAVGCPSETPNAGQLTSASDLACDPADWTSELVTGCRLFPTAGGARVGGGLLAVAGTHGMAHGSPSGNGTRPSSAGALCHRYNASERRGLVQRATRHPCPHSR